MDVECARGRQVDYVGLQLALSLAAIHTTSDLLSKCIVQLCDTPEIVKPLREEVIQVLRTDGWSKQTLYKLKLIDSFLEEIQQVIGRDTSKLLNLTIIPSMTDGI